MAYRTTPFMGKLLIPYILVHILLSCNAPKNKTLKEGTWLATLRVMDHQQLPFNFSLLKNKAGKYRLEIYNAEEIIHVDEIRIKNDSIFIKFPVFEGYIAGTFSETRIEGNFIKESLDRIVPFEANFGNDNRFETLREPNQNLTGIWEAEFEGGTPDAYMAQGIFIQNNNLVMGTFRTTTGDYRYLQGVLDGDSLKLSTFDGAHAFLFVAEVLDSTLVGNFYSGNHSKEVWIAKRNPSFELPPEDPLTFLTNGFDTMSFSFPDTSGNMVSLNDPEFGNSIKIVQIMGTWCPNCLDETKFFVDYLKNNPNPEIKFIALAFEYAKTPEGAIKAIKRLKKRIGVPYPILLAQYGSSNKISAQEKLPMLNHVLSYPTTLFIDRKGVIRKINTGFNGPATGEKYQEFKWEFDRIVKQLLAE
jgi:thiol-disulfide isomerase/thioredoxin